MTARIADANSQAITDFSSYKDRSWAKFKLAGSFSRCRLNKFSRGGRTAFPIGLDHRRALHIENPGSQRYATTPALKLQRLVSSIGSTWQPNGLPAWKTLDYSCFQACVIGFVLFHLNSTYVWRGRGQHGIHNWERVGFANPKLLPKKIASMEIGTVVPPWHVERHTTFLGHG